MKVKRTVLKSIIAAVIKEQTELPEPQDSNDLKMAYKAIVEVTMSPEWGKAVSDKAVAVVKGAFGKLIDSGTFSLTQLSEFSTAAMASSRFMSHISPISAKAFQSSPSFQQSTPRAKEIAKDSLNRVMKVAFSSLIGSEISYVILYNLKEISPEMAAVYELTRGNNPRDQAYMRLRTRGEDASSKPTLPADHVTIDDIDSVKVTFENLDPQVFKVAAQYAWESIMKFVGFTHKEENSHFKDVADLELFGLEDWMDPFHFGFEVPAPF